MKQKDGEHDHRSAARWCLFVVLLISTNSGIAQLKQEPTFHANRPLRTKVTFGQRLNIYDWLYVLDYQKDLDNRLSLAVNESFQSTLQSISSDDLWKDNQKLSIAMAYRVSDRLAAEANVLSHVLSDQLAGFDNDVVFNSATTRLIYKPLPRVQMRPWVGSHWQTQTDQSDRGTVYGFDASVADLALHGYRNDLNLLGEQAVFPRRKNQDLRINYRLERQFYESTADTLTLVAERLRRDSFDADADGLFVRDLVQTNRGFDNRLSYRISSDAGLHFTNALFATGFRVTNVKDDTSEVRRDDEGFESRHAVRVHVAKRGWFGSLGWSFRFRERNDQRPRSSKPDPFGRFPSIGFDTEDALVTLTGRTGFAVSRSDSLSLFASASKFQFDTSDTTNSNSHDQQRWQVTVSHVHRFDRSLQLAWRASAFLNHFVFISGRFSSGNNWERNLQLTPEIVYAPGRRLHVRQSFTVRAKYQTFDFDDPATSNRNLVNRQFILTNASRYRFSARNRLELRFNLELAEQGKFFYRLWRQQRALSWRNSEVQGTFKHQAGSGWQFSTGFSFFQQTRWEHRVGSAGRSERFLNERHTSVGPTAEVFYRPGPTIEVAFAGNVQFSTSTRRRSERVNLFDLNLNWSL